MDKTCFICHELGHNKRHCPFTQRMPKNYESFLDSDVSHTDQQNIKTAKSNYVLNCGTKLDDIDTNNEDECASKYDSMFPEESELIKWNTGKSKFN